ncbi:acetyl-CoA C-acetyltransferase [Streptomyces chartreusis]|uniref:acetyl-CoA C-acetyltransferase n=1 Tax=Streptomyces chartreusis TaxID=1969 RepID=UPI002E821476|nr:acetyl-CoA C-acetyltransferase [Streptomyces chartreusis]WUB19903.1 acetyl-CoA C-acetyltransferase [Streptomyces chartreusis]
MSPSDSSGTSPSESSGMSSGKSSGASPAQSSGGSSVRRSGATPAKSSGGSSSKRSAPAPAVRRVAVIGGTRIPFARSDGPYATASNQDMLTAALDGLVERYGLGDPGAVGEFVAGAVLKHSRDFNLARETVLGSELDARTPAYDIQQACGTGLQAVIAAANKIALGQTEAAIAGGADTASDAPLGVNDRLRRTLLEARRAKSLGGRVKALSQVRPSHLVPDIPRNAEPRTKLSMGEHAAVTARAWGVTREAQDELAAASHRRLAAAYERGFFEDLVVPFRGLDRDQNLRPGSTPEKLAALKPVFGLDGEHPTMTAGNSTPLTDGAALVLLASEEWAERRGLEPLAYLTAHETAAVDFVHGDVAGGEDGLLMAPAYAVPRMLERAGLGLDDFEFVEVHEAFASQVLATLAAWEKRGLAPVDRARLNVNGSSLATGHPFAATGARIVATLAKSLAESGGSGRGLISVCAAGGQGVTAILERR